ncbi:pyridoxal-phosphate dependent enzyme [Miniphocaeibacter massiliensis]|uniref:pyridoxal-phosphate dependent enzyme n=1 Tax=Miniphocaeibacter massiliensis TaxID=2041841 RepID=UPI000C1BA744|nr:pyridoxal-phosphate dependent enzyme [Miniphocaeibacter massiliensis]
MFELLNLKVNEEKRKEVAKYAKERGIRIPTLAQMKDPSKIPADVKEKLKTVGLWDVNPLNLYRVSWKNEPKAEGGLYQDLPNYVEIPSVVSGVKSKILFMSGKYFPTGCHKVGASFACLVPRLVTGQFDPKTQEAVWPSTGNYCRGGAFNAALLGCKSIAILPESMSRERFDWLEELIKTYGGEIFATSGSESNVKEIYDKTWELIDERGDGVVIFNQFAELGNHLWHYEVTGEAMNDLFLSYKAKNDKANFFGVNLNSGSGGSLGAGDKIKDLHPNAKITVSEALQCPTLLDNGFGDHRIEGIGDKHIPWVHNVKNSNLVTAIDDEDAVSFFRILNDPLGHDYFRSLGVDEDTIDKFKYIGISGAANIISCIKTAKYFETTENDIFVTVGTDSAEMYQSRLEEYNAERGALDAKQVEIDHNVHVLGLKTDNMLELRYTDKKRIHNLKYYTWVEQQGKTAEELNAQWYDYDNYWTKLHTMGPEFDRVINEFNALIDEM